MDWTRASLVPKVSQTVAGGMLEPPVSQDKWSRWASGKAEPEREYVRQWAKIVGQSTEWFYEEHNVGFVEQKKPTILEERRTYRNVSVVPRQMRPIPVLATITAGEPWMQNADVEYEEVPDWGSDLERWGRVIEGESMLPILRPGDRAIFENRRHEAGQVVHAFDDGADTVKCVKGNGPDMKLVPFNDDYEPFPAKGWNVKGVCVGRIRYGLFGARSFTEFPGGLSWGMRLTDF